MSYKLRVADAMAAIESVAPPAYQEDYDNAGLIVGNPKKEIEKALICIDITEEVVEEAILKNAQLIVAHHPIIFRGLKRLNGSNYVERCVIKAIKHDIAIYAAHTNLDSVDGGVNTKIAEKIGLKNTAVLDKKRNDLKKLVTFVPTDYLDAVRKAVFEAGGGHIGNYDQCGYATEGKGSFRALEGAAPYVGNLNEMHQEAEMRFETIFPAHKQRKVVSALDAEHPYEEVAYDIYSIENENPKVGIGLVGELEHETDALVFLKTIKKTFDVGCLKHTKISERKIKRVAVGGGSCSFLLRKAIAAKADVFISSDFKYHEYFDAENKIIIADIGHFESEQFTKEVIKEILSEKFPNFACCLSETNTNPVEYL